MQRKWIIVLISVFVGVLLFGAVLIPNLVPAWVPAVTIILSIGLIAYLVFGKRQNTSTFSVGEEKTLKRGKVSTSITLRKIASRYVIIKYQINLDGTALIDKRQIKAPIRDDGSFQLFPNPRYFAWRAKHQGDLIRVSCYLRGEVVSDTQAKIKLTES